jgi:hypothetical protein
LWSRFDSIQHWQPDVEEDQVGLLFFGVTHCLQPVGRFVDDL